MKIKSGFSKKRTEKNCVFTICRILAYRSKGHFFGAMSENESRVANVRTQLFRITTYEPVDYMGGAQPVRPSKLRSCVTLRNIPVGTPPPTEFASESRSMPCHRLPGTRKLKRKLMNPFVCLACNRQFAEKHDFDKHAMLTKHGV